MSTTITLGARSMTFDELEVGRRFRWARRADGATYVKIKRTGYQAEPKGRVLGSVFTALPSDMSALVEPVAPVPLPTRRPT